MDHLRTAHILVLQKHFLINPLIILITEYLIRKFKYESIVCSSCRVQTEVTCVQNSIPSFNKSSNFIFDESTYLYNQLMAVTFHLGNDRNIHKLVSVTMDFLSVV